ncbi:hypothetical protein SEA_SIXAMA_12 [Gordonia phage Sixama]|uniref:Uncharacterized protein n=1 Tax=Gordonia phage Sixama TaxID=2653271 RepID=A0A5Q2F1R5_9CAUD|nr:hypothetical protein PP302_gp012 [Gordonia phage Sixama]QGF20191.1 hypothetical protein SEA_SIXAMA_12 [Gordonia phage Sixama]
MSRYNDDGAWYPTGIFRAVEKRTGDVWCESSNESEVRRKSAGKNVEIFQLYRRGEEAWRSETAETVFQHLGRLGVKWERATVVNGRDGNYIVFDARELDRAEGRRP